MNHENNHTAAVIKQQTVLQTQCSLQHMQAVTLILLKLKTGNIISKKQTHLSTV